MIVLDRTAARLGLDGPRALMPLAVLFGLSAVDAADQSAFAVLGPDIRDAFGLGNAGITVFAALLVPTVLVLGIPFGFLADRCNRVRIASLGAVTWAVFCVLTGFAPVLWVLFVARLGAGIGGAVNAPTHQSLLADYYEPSTRPKVYGAYQVASNVGQGLGPLAAGAIAAVAGWRVPFIVLAPVTLVLVGFAVRLTEPSRGGLERRAEGVDDALVDSEDAAPGWEESWRVLQSVGTLRQVYRAAPLLAGGVIATVLLSDLFASDVFGLGSASRGVIDASTQPFAVCGLVLGAVVSGRLLASRPARVFVFITICATVAALGFLGVALAPSVGAMVAWRYLVAVAGSAILPGLVSVVSLVTPPRARSFGFSAFQIYALPGLLVLPAAGLVSDRFGMRWGIALMVPIFLAGGYLLGYAGVYIQRDIEQIRRLTAARTELRAARAAGRVPLLMVRDLEVCYGPVQVLFGVDLDVADGEIVALVGTNGAGKSTLLRAVTGTLPASAGAVFFDGREISAMPPQEILRLGMAYMWGGRGVFQTLSVHDNLLAAAWTVTDATAERIDEVYESFPALVRYRDTVAGNLSGGEQQMLALGMAFLSRPRLLLIDELSLGLAPAVVATLVSMVKRIHDAGTTVVIVEQSINVALTLAQRAVFLEKGEVRFNGPTGDLLERPEVLRAVFFDGGDTDRRVLARPRAETHQPAATEALLEATGLTKAFGGLAAVSGVDLSVTTGEIVGIIGPNGAGKTTLFDLLAGYLVPDAGSLSLAGRRIDRLRAASRARLGLGRSFQDAKLVPSMTVREVLALAHERHLSFAGVVPVLAGLPEQRAEEAVLRRRVGQMIDELGLADYAEKFIHELSTGTRRIVEFGAVIAHRPQLLLLDEPSSGIAQREAEALGPLLLRLHAITGASLVVIEHDIPLITSIADRLVAMDAGAVVAVGSPSDVLEHPSVISSYLGSDQTVIARSGAPTRSRK